MRFIFVFVLLISSALACPDISGKYASCRSSTGEISGSKDIVIEQKIINKIHHISMSATDEETQERTTDHYKADGKPSLLKETDPDTGVVLATEFITTCNDKNVLIKAKIDLNGENVANMNFKLSKINGELIQDISGDSFGTEIADKVICN